MSEKRMIELPEGGATKQLVQYGVRWPNGKIDWAELTGVLKLDTSQVYFSSNFNIHPKYRNDKYTNGIDKIIAGNSKVMIAAGLDHAEYVAPVLVERTVILITLDPEDVIE